MCSLFVFLRNVAFQGVKVQLEMMLFCSVGVLGVSRVCQGVARFCFPVFCYFLVFYCRASNYRIFCGYSSLVVFFSIFQFFFSVFLLVFVS